MSVQPLSDNDLKVIALYLPQYHPIPENNRWWGNGFTEWVNVAKARTRFKGHYQPHLPKDLGFYDLRLAETRAAQAELAKRYGVYGFCYYHYWFNGRRILERPVDEILASGEPDFPYMLCWANENWSRNWDGGFDEVLIEQQYSVEDFVEHARHLLPYFKDSRYIKVDGKPFFVIYKDLEIENLADCISAFRNELSDHGVDVYLCRFERWSGTSEDTESAYSCFDGGIEFQPLSRQFKKMMEHDSVRYEKFLNPKAYCQWLSRNLGLSKRFPDRVIKYREVVDNDLKFNFQRNGPVFPGVCPGWDNSPRRQNGKALILDGSTPDLFEMWVQQKVLKTDWSLIPEKFLFVNAWNEWAEGNHLEPCQRWDKKYLEALKRALDNCNQT